jgi:hypothetical protein
LDMIDRSLVLAMTQGIWRSTYERRKASASIRTI